MQTFNFPSLKITSCDLCLKANFQQDLRLVEDIGETRLEMHKLGEEIYVCKKLIKLILTICWGKRGMELSLTVYDCFLLLQCLVLVFVSSNFGKTLKIKA